MKTITILLTITLGVLMVFTSCKKKGCTDVNADNYDAKAKKDDGTCIFTPVSDSKTDFRVMFHHKSGTSNFALNTTYVDDFGNNYQFNRAQMYISNPRFFDDNGDLIGDQSLKAYALVSSATETYNFGKVPVGHIHTMNFTVGVDSVANHSDPSTYAIGHPLANQSPSIHWSWNTGYIFIAIEGVVDIDNSGTYDANETFLFHIGLDANKVTVPLNAHFNAVANVTSTVHINLDWSKLISDIDLSIDNSTHSMGAGATLAGRVKNNVTSVFSLH